MKHLSIVLCLGLALAVHASARLVVPSLPEAVRPFAEVETNVVFSTGAATDNKWTLTIERDAAVSNSLEVVFGRDANEDGVLGIEEGAGTAGSGSGATGAQTRRAALWERPSALTWCYT